jgi:hypothetical protein
MLQELCQHEGVDVEASKQDVQSFSEATEIHKLASDHNSVRANKTPEAKSISQHSIDTRVLA